MTKHKEVLSLEQELENLENIISMFEMTFTDHNFDIYTKIASVAMRIGDMRISLDRIKELVKIRTEVSSS